MLPANASSNLFIHGSSFNEIRGDYNYFANSGVNPHESGQRRIHIVLSENIDPTIPLMHRRTREAFPGIGKGRSV